MNKTTNDIAGEPRELLTKNVVQLDADGYFMGMTVADESPLEPGRFVLPALAQDIAPPPRLCKEMEAVRWMGGIWQYVPDYSAMTLYSTIDGHTLLPRDIERGKSLAELEATLLRPESGQHWDARRKCWAWAIEQTRERKLQALASMRWDVQCSGVLVDGVRFDSSPDAATRLKATIEDAQAAGVDIVAFKAPDGFMELSLQQLAKARAAIFTHTQSCYAAEQAHTEALALLHTADDIEAYNLQSGWPS